MLESYKLINLLNMSTFLPNHQVYGLLKKFVCWVLGGAVFIWAFARAGAFFVYRPNMLAPPDD